MTLALSRKSLLMLAAVAVLAAALWLRERIAAESAVGAPAPATVSLPMAKAPAADAVPDALARAAISPPRAIQRHRMDFERVQDLYAYARELEAAERAGDADAGWMLSRVHDYCAGYALDPAGYALDTRALDGMHLPTSPALVAARERIGRRCAGFAPQDALDRDAILARRTAAAKAGSLAAEASLLALGQPLAEAASYKRGLLLRVLASRDPEAFLALAPAMGIAASGEEAFEDQVAGTRFTELAWQMAACRLGLDCGASGALMTSYCANAGICSRDRQQDFVGFVLDAAVPRQGEDAMRGMVETLLNETGTSR